ncbi:MAG TPA: secretin N-terminal domain-containing protein [Verrucomicrobiae bacterium]
MQAQVRILSLAVLLSTATLDFAQPAPTAAPGTTPATNATGSANPTLEPVMRRRFQRLTNQALANTNTAAAPATAPNTTPATTGPATATAGSPVETTGATPNTTAAPQRAQPQFPQIPSVDSIRSNAAAARAAALATNRTAAPAGTAVITPPPTVVDQSQTAVIETNSTANIQLPTPGTAQPAVNVEGSDRTSIPIPPATDATATATDAAAAVRPDPVSPYLDPNEPIPPGGVALNNTPLDPAVWDVYSRYSGRTVLRPTVLPAPAGITLITQTPLTRREVVEALDAVLALNGITMIPIGDKFVKAQASALADKEGAPLNEVPAEELGYTEQFITRVVKLKTAKPSEIAPTLQTMTKMPTAVTAVDSNQTLILRDYSSNIKRMLEIIEKIDVMPETDFTLEVIPVRYGKVGDIHATMQALISGAGGGVAGGATLGGVGGTGTFGRGAQTGGFGGAGRTGSMGGRYGGGGMNQYGGSGMYGGGNRGNYGGGGGNYYPYEEGNEKLNEVNPMQVAPGASPGGAQNSFQNRLNQIVNRAANQDQVQILENAQIVPDERSNKLLIFANKRDMAMITNIVSKVDVLLAQVLIEAVIMEVKLGDNLNFGVSAVQHPRQWGKDFQGAGSMLNGNILQNITNFPSGAGSGFSYFGTINDDFDVAITALAGDSEIKIISRPRIHTSHAMPGFFFIGETVPYVTGSYDYGVVGSVASRSIINERQVGLTLEVTPIITPEGMVIMDIVQDFQQRGQDVIIDGNPIPLVNSRAAGSFLTVRNGDLIMLGGFISETRSNTKSGVPFLKDIPGLGVLFRSTNKSNDRTELIMLIKATVLDSPEEAAFLAEQERLMLPGVRQAEHEFERSGAKRQQKAEKRTRR